MKRVLGIVILIILICVNIFAQNQVLSLDGFNDYVSMENLNQNNIGDFTISCWFKIESHNPYGRSYIYDFRGDGFDTGNGSGVFIDDAGNNESFILHFCTWPSGGYSQFHENMGNILTQWHFTTLVREYDVLKEYIDGVLISDNPTIGISPTNELLNFNNNWRIGNYSAQNINGDNYWFNGDVDEIRIWNFARNQNEIQQNMSHQLTGDEAGLIGYWNFDNGTVTDLTVNDNDGTLQGGAIIIQEEIPGFFDANFTSPEAAYIGEPIQFIDTSTGNPTIWEWDFDNDGIYDSTYYSYQNSVYWTYENTNVDSVKLKINKGTLVDSLTKAITVSYCPPASPQNVNVEISGEDAIISWTAVDTTECGSTITPDLYVIQYNEIAQDSDYFYLSYVLHPNLNFNHFGVLQYGNNGEPADHMFYKVIAIKNYSRKQIEYLESLNNSRERIKWSDVKRNLKK